MESLKFAVKPKFTDTKLIFKDGKTLFHSAYVLGKTASWLEAALSWNNSNRKKGQEMPYEITLSNVSAEFFNQVLDIIDSVSDIATYAGNIISEYNSWHHAHGRLHEKIYELFDFMSEYAPEWQNEMFIKDIFALVVKEVGFSDDLVLRFLEYSELFESGLPDLVEYIFAEKMDESIYAKLNDEVIEKICKAKAPGLSAIGQTLEKGYNLSDLHPMLRQIVIDAVENESINIGQGGIATQTYKFLVKKYIDYLKIQKGSDAPANNEITTGKDEESDDCVGGNCCNDEELDDSFERNYIYASSDESADAIADPDDLI